MPTMLPSGYPSTMPTRVPSMGPAVSQLDVEQVETTDIAQTGDDYVPTTNELQEDNGIFINTLLIGIGSGLFVCVLIICIALGCKIRKINKEYQNSQDNQINIQYPKQDFVDDDRQQHSLTPVEDAPNVVAAIGIFGKDQQKIFEAICELQQEANALASEGKFQQVIVGHNAYDSTEFVVFGDDEIGTKNGYNTLG